MLRNEGKDEKTMNYDYNEKKFVIVLSSKLEIGEAFNVVGHLSISAGYYAENHMGRKELIDGSGGKHIGISKYPVIITKVKPSKIKSYLERAKETEGIMTIDYPSNMYDTGHDDELAESLKGTMEENMEYWGFLIFGNRNLVDEITGKFSLWR